MGADGLGPSFGADSIHIQPDLPPTAPSAFDTPPSRSLKRSQAALKRGIDLFASLVLLACLSPLLIVISVAIGVTSKGPILFRQPRVGFLNRQFVCLKFRTMFDEDTDLGCDVQAQLGDLRVTSVGRWLRRFSLDELPQLLNVLRGEMSLVGPRPHALSTKAGNVPFHLALKDYSNRHSVLPGMTGLAQIRGCRGRTATVEDIRRRVDLDLHYIRHWSIGLDLHIMFGTLFHLATYKDAV